MRFSAEAALSGFQQLAASFIATAVVSCSLAAYRSDLCVVLRRRRTAPPRFSSSPLTSISFLLPPSLPLPTTDVVLTLFYLIAFTLKFFCDFRCSCSARQLGFNNSTNLIC
ncbi:hypothetical protein PIB30_035694 [Stylosanthes scabra]|uniref:Uncharacterized protein n=1 Tax=Stylosanthes scabra TaxID=79078 RepID=A0ABU6VC06_9FABA|nr:hypothetical protein [Stylosanthes scabra]